MPKKDNMTQDGVFLDAPSKKRHGNYRKQMIIWFDWFWTNNKSNLLTHGLEENQKFKHSQHEVNLKLEWPQSSSGRRFEMSLNRRGPRWRLLGSSSSPSSSGLRCSTVTGRELISHANSEKVFAKTLQCFQTWFVSGGLILNLEIKL